MHATGAALVSSKDANYSIDASNSMDSSSSYSYRAKRDEGQLQVGLGNIKTISSGRDAKAVGAPATQEFPRKFTRKNVRF
jgi:hypothetical protein